jgi:hypothetical protein
LEAEPIDHGLQGIFCVAIKMGYNGRSHYNVLSVVVVRTDQSMELFWSVRYSIRSNANKQSVLAIISLLLLAARYALQSLLPRIAHI